MNTVFIGKRIADLRKLKGRTQTDLAEYFGVTKQAVSKWENGYSMPDVLLLPKLADYFDVDIDTFFSDSYNEKKNIDISKFKKAICVENLCKKYKSKIPVYALNDVSLDIYEGMSTAIMGPSGCGKSTFLQCVSGLEKITSGKVSIKGTDITSISDDKITRFRRKNISFIFQSYNLIESLTVKDNIYLPYKLIGEKVKKSRYKELLINLGLKEKEKSFPSELSGGQQQRVAIARALLGKDKIIFADEPTGALDINSGKEVLSLLISGIHVHGGTVIIVTHDINVAAECDVVHFFADGKCKKTLIGASKEEISNIMLRLTKDD